MINLLVPMAGTSKFFADAPFPKPLYEVNGKLMIQYVISSLRAIAGAKRFLFVVNDVDCARFHLDDTLRLLTDDRAVVTVQQGPGKGAACSCLWCIDHIDSDDELLISNSDQLVDIDLNVALDAFRGADARAGVVTFDSVHPKWSYVSLDNEGRVTEAAEKRPISRNAIAGLYYFRHGRDFVRAACKSIRKDSNVQGLYFVAPTLNELLLEGLRVTAYKIETKHYHSFYSTEKIEHFERNYENNRK